MSNQGDHSLGSTSCLDSLGQRCWLCHLPPGRAAHWRETGVKELPLSNKTGRNVYGSSQGMDCTGLHGCVGSRVLLLKDPGGFLYHC